MCLAYLTLLGVINLVMPVKRYPLRKFAFLHLSSQQHPVLKYIEPILSLTPLSSTPTQSNNTIKMTVFWIFITCSVMCQFFRNAETNTLQQTVPRPRRTSSWVTPAVRTWKPIK
jgi:hypothetical protein